MSPVTLKSASFSAGHLFATRQGGVSPVPFDSLNLGRAVGDAPEHVEQNARRLAEAAGFEVGALVTVRQVHGVRLVEVEGAVGGARFAPPLAEADGLYSRRGGVVLGVLTADCAPVLLYAADVPAVAAVHAGWRGALVGIAGGAVARLAEAYGASPARVQAVVGPCIHACCYEVDATLAERFVTRFGPTVRRQGVAGTVRLDIAEASRLSLLEAGVPAAQVTLSPHCTCCQPQLFFSHRRDAGRSGRQISLVWLPSPGGIAPGE